MKHNCAATMFAEIHRTVSSPAFGNCYKAEYENYCKQNFRFDKAKQNRQVVSIEDDR